jgi:type II secretion system protein N
MIERLAWPALPAIKEPIGWGAATLLCFLLFFFITFPYGNMQAKVLAEFTRSTGLEVRAGDWSSALPLGFEWRDVVLTGPAGATPIESLRVTIGFLPAMVGRVAIDYAVLWPGAAQAGAGRASGTLTARSWSFQGPVAIKGHIQQVELASMLKPYVSRGVLQGDFSQRAELSQGTAPLLKGDGIWKAEVKDLLLERIPAGTAVIPSLAFSRITAIVNCHDVTCDVAELKGDGIDGSFSATGRVIVQQPIQQSQLDLTVTLLPGAGFAQKSAGLGLPGFQPGTQFIVKLAGPIQQPRVIL